MGCWNKTCGLTRLPIFDGEDTFVFVIQRNEPGESRCYSTALYAPLLLPFKAKYNDYGGGKECSGYSNLIMGGVAKHLVEMEVGENEHHDIEVKREGFDEEKFFETVHEDRLFMLDYERKPNQLEFVMMRAKSVRYVLDNWEMEKYVGEGKGNRPDDTSKYSPNSYLYYKFQDVIDTVPALIDMLSDKMRKAKDDMDRFIIATSGFEFLSDDELTLSGRAMRLAAGSNYRFCSVVRPTSEILNLVKDGKRDEAIQMTCDFLVGYYINDYMDETRLIWTPGCHEGSQSDAGKEHTLLANAIIQGVQDRKTMYGEDESEDDESDFMPE